MRSLLLSLLLVLALAAPAAAAPNVVLIQTDDQTLESLRVMERTRALIGEHGATFENAFVSLSLCCPSRASLLTGRYAHNHGVLDIHPPWGGFERLDGAETLPVWLQRAGYATALVGKYLNRYGRRDPHELPPGWTEWHGLVDPSTYGYYRYTINHDGVLRRHGASEADYQTDVITGRAEAIVERRAASPQPFFLWVSYLAPHNGLPREPGDPPGASPVPAPRHRGAFAGEPLPRTPAFDEADVSDKPAAIRRRPRLTPADQRRIAHHYRQELESLLAVDEGVERIVAALERSGELEDTLLVFTSDNGYLHGQHRVPAGKVLPYEPSIRVPLLMRGPGVPRGLRLGQLAANVDLAPTILEAAGATAPWEADGLALQRFLRDPGLETGRDLLIEGPARRRDGGLRFTGLRSPRHLLLERDTGDRELYDLAADQHQLRNLAGTPGAAELEAALMRRLARLRGCAGAACRPLPDLELTLRPLAGGFGRSIGCHVAVGLAGRARGRVRAARLSVDGLAAGRLRRGALRAVLRAGAGTVRARVRLAGDRVVTLDRVLPGC